jgi:5-methylcytosine-specific restriction enzyme subunit McrC
MVSISEYGKIGKDKYDSEKYTSETIDKYQFEELESFAKDNSKVFRYVNKNTLQAVNGYVGVIKTENLTLEILPKIHQKVYEENQEKENQKNRDILNKMLLKVLNPNALEGTNADLDSLEDMNIFEVFIKMFANSVDELIRKGVKSDYMLQEDNLPYLKGKIQFSNHIRYNLAHKERFYVEFDEYLPDRVENRLIKTCIDFLLDKSQDSENQRLLREQLFFFDDVSYSTNIEYDISCIQDLHGGMEHYETPLNFAKIFLQNKSFTPTVGDDSAFSFLFPMAVIFERYVEVLLRDSGIDVESKFNNEYFLENEDKNDKQISLEPDYMFKFDNKRIVADAKWKLYDEDKETNLKREDIFQVYSYMSYFDSDRGYIFTPKIHNSNTIEVYSFQKKERPEKYFQQKQLIVYKIDLEKDKINLIGE